MSVASTQPERSGPAIGKRVKAEPELVILRGLPGSGKSTKAKKEFPSHLHYEPDHLLCDTRGSYRFDLQIFQEAQKMVEHLADFALARGEDVVVSDVFPLLSDLEPYRKLASTHRALIRVIDVAGNFENSHNVPLFVLKRMKSTFEPYSDNELVDSFLPEALKRQAD
jgi:hypothetical protein